MGAGSRPCSCGGSHWVYSRSTLQSVTTDHVTQLSWCCVTRQGVMGTGSGGTRGLLASRNVRW